MDTSDDSSRELHLFFPDTTHAKSIFKCTHNLRPDIQEYYKTMAMTEEATRTVLKNFKIVDGHMDCSVDKS